ncbi:hypothetical protein BT69DRAFT_1308593 [Atractiella rhizophila]|nr:hypothetical protein BT69DRAFT_1308593 [Atractiella rhizophila]
MRGGRVKPTLLERQDKPPAKKPCLNRNENKQAREVKLESYEEFAKVLRKVLEGNQFVSCHPKSFSLLRTPEVREELRAWMRNEKFSMDPSKVVDYSLVHMVNKDLPDRLKSYVNLELFPRIEWKPTKANDGKTHSWMLEGRAKLRKKGQGRGIHRSDFLCSTFGHLADAGVQIEYGKNHDGFWTGELILTMSVKQVKTKLIPLFEQLYPGQQMLLLLDNSQGHSFFAKDALRATEMNLNPGGVQARLRPGWYEKDGLRIIQPMVDVNGTPKGIKTILKEHGLWIDGLRENCDYTFEGLKRTIPAALKSVKLSTIRKFEQRTLRWVQAYSEGKNVVDASYQVKKYSSHRRVPEKAASRDDYYFAD